MTQTRDSNAWLFLKVTIFTLVVPGTVAVYLPWMILGERAQLAAIDVEGISMLGILAIAVGLVLYVRSAFHFAWEGRGTPAPIDPPKSVVRSGPYRYCRNPMYVGVLSAIAGEAILFAEIRLLVYLAAVWALLACFIIFYEERVLSAQFGDAYGTYRATVPRWIPTTEGFSRIFARTFLHVGAFVFTAGVAAHLLRLTVGLPVVDTPDSIHALLVILPAYAGIGCLRYSERIDRGGVAGTILFILSTALLLVTAIAHLYSILASDSRWLGIFPRWYSVAAIVAYGSFALYLATRTLQFGDSDGDAGVVHPATGRTP